MSKKMVPNIILAILIPRYFYLRFLQKQFLFFFSASLQSFPQVQTNLAARNIGLLPCLTHAHKIDLR